MHPIIKRWVAPIGGSNQKVGGTDWRSIDCRQHRFSTPNSGSTRYRHRTPRMGVSFSEGGWHRLAVEALDQNHPDNPKPQKSQKPPDHSSTSCPPSSKGGWHRLAVGRLSAAPIVDSQQRQHPLSAPNPSHGGKFFKRWVAPIGGQKVGGTDCRSKGGWHRLRGGWNAWNAGSDRRPLWMLDATKAPR